jgi:hypothetical protein
VGFKPHAEQCRPGRAALLCAFHRGEVCPRVVFGEGGAWPRGGADKGQEAPGGGVIFLVLLQNNHFFAVFFLVLLQKMIMFGPTAKNDYVIV